MPTISEAFAIAFAHHETGRLDVAEEICRRVLAVEPNHAHALHLLGVVAYQRAECQAAVELIDRAITIDPDNRGFYINLGEAQDRRINNCHPERNEGSPCAQARSFAALRMTANSDSY